MYGTFEMLQDSGMYITHRAVQIISPRRQV
jgi:hypothetical protein